MLQALHALTCFNQVKTIVPIAAGLSSHCYQVNADNKAFFAKQIVSANEVTISLQAAKKNISPNVIYHDQQWLINEFIVGENLALAQQPTNQNISMALELMAQCHQLTATPTPLDPKSITDELINRDFFSNKQKVALLHTAQQLISQLVSSKNLVCCHGDLNFSNILVGSKKAYLVDFECARSAPAEYDLAMFIAVNNINKNQVSTIIAHYINYADIAIDLPLLHHFLRFCYFINGLWYSHAYHQTKLDKFALLAQQQWPNMLHE